MALTLRIENETNLPDGGPIEYRLTGRRGIDIGRDSHLDWSLPDPTRYISSRHCEVRYEKGGYVLYDVSTNGTFLNGSDRRMGGPHRLKTGDRIIIGNYIVAVDVDASDLGEASKPRQPAARASDPWDVPSSAPPVDRKDVLVPVDRRPNIDPLDWAIDLPDVTPADRRPTPRERPFDPGPPSGAAAAWAVADPAPAMPSTAAALDPWNDPPPAPAAQPATPRSFAPPPAIAPAAAPVAAMPPPPPIPAPPFAPGPQLPPDPPYPPLMRGETGDSPETKAIPKLRKAPAANVAATAGGAETEARAMPTDALAARRPDDTPPTRPARSAEPPTVAAAALAATGGGTFQADAASLMARFAAGAGISPDALAHRDAGDIMEDLGGMIRLVVDNLMDLNAARRETKRVMRSADHTVIGAQDNNPLKFMPTTDHALISMLDRPTRSYLNGPAALEESFADLQNHQKRVFIAMQQAMRLLFEDIDPAAIDKSVEGDRGMASLIGSRKSRLWDNFVTRWQAKTKRNEDGIVGLFMLYFADCYDRLGETTE